MVGTGLTDLPLEVLIVIALHLTGLDFRAFTAACRASHNIWKLATCRPADSSIGREQHRELRDRVAAFLQACGEKLYHHILYQVQVKRQAKGCCAQRLIQDG